MDDRHPSIHGRIQYSSISLVPDGTVRENFDSILANPIRYDLGSGRRSHRHRCPRPGRLDNFAKSHPRTGREPEESTRSPTTAEPARDNARPPTQTLGVRPALER